MTVYDLNPTLGNHILDGASANTAFDGFATPSIGESAVKRRAILKFTQPSVTCATVTLSLKSQGDYGGQTYTCYRLLQAVTNAVTWNKYDGTNNWNNAGGLGVGDVDAVALGSVTQSITSGAWLTIPLNAAEVMKMGNGTYTNNGFIIAGSATVEFVYFNYNYATESYRPILHIETPRFIPGAICF